MYAKNEHIRVIENMIEEIKERARFLFQGLPYNRLPKIMIKELITGIVMT